QRRSGPGAAPAAHPGGGPGAARAGRGSALDGGPPHGLGPHLRRRRGARCATHRRARPRPGPRRPSRSLGAGPGLSRAPGALAVAAVAWVASAVLVRGVVALPERCEPPTPEEAR